MERIRQTDEILVPFIVVGELRAGFTGGDRARENEATLVRFLDSRRVDLMFADEGTPHHYARLFQQLRRQRTPIPTNDLWIAALVVQHQLPLFARDTHFDPFRRSPAFDAHHVSSGRGLTAIRRACRLRPLHVARPRP